MKVNNFSKCGPKLDQGDMMKLESDLGVSMPESMKAHYLVFNGGMPELDWVPMTNDWEPIWLHEFLPIAKNDGQAPSIQSVFRKIAGKAGFPVSYIPFAIDPGGNIFCVAASDGTVHYWLTDTFDKDLTESENMRKSDRWIADSFEDFLASLVSEDDAFE